MLLWEKKVFLDGSSIIIGVDEAGRGPLAGPVVAAAVLVKPSPLKRRIFPEYKERVDDSKKMTPLQRERAFREISKKTFFNIALKSQGFIDRNNIYSATLRAMQEAVSGLLREYARVHKKREVNFAKDVCILIDGNMKPDLPYRTVQILKGDSKSFSIAMASIVAKVTRDRLMVSYDKKFPGYGFSRHKGYGTRFHIEAIRKYGPCPLHRKTFAPIRKDDDCKDKSWKKG